MSRPTLADVAAAAGVSAKTVSNVLLGRSGVSDATRQVVLDAITRVGYAVNPAARGLASGHTGRIAVVVPLLYQPYFAEMAEGFILALAAHGLSSTLRIAPDARAEMDAVTGRSTPDVDGVLICPHHITTERLSGLTLPRPVVQVGSGPTAQIDGVFMGEREGAEAVAQHLADTGRERVALVWNAAPGQEPTGFRYDVYRAALAVHGLDVSPDLIARGSDWDRRATGYEAMVGLLLSGARFDAAACVNDAVAVGALRALRRHGRRVPEDVALTGFDDTDEGEFTTPSLTSVSPNQSEMVAAAIELLLSRLGGFDGAARHRYTGAHLVVRDSTRAVQR